MILPRTWNGQYGYWYYSVPALRLELYGCSQNISLLANTYVTKSNIQVTNYDFCLKEAYCNNYEYSHVSVFYPFLQTVTVRKESK